MTICVFFLQDRIPGPQDEGGCPFKHFDKDNIMSLLDQEGIHQMAAQDIGKIATHGSYSAACEQYLREKATMVRAEGQSTCCRSQSKTMFKHQGSAKLQMTSDLSQRPMEKQANLNTMLKPQNIEGPLSQLRALEFQHTDAECSKLLYKSDKKTLTGEQIDTRRTTVNVSIKDRKRDKECYVEPCPVAEKRTRLSLAEALDFLNDGQSYDCTKIPAQVYSHNKTDHEICGNSKIKGEAIEYVTKMEFDCKKVSGHSQSTWSGQTQSTSCKLIFDQLGIESSQDKDRMSDGEQDSHGYGDASEEFNSQGQCNDLEDDKSEELFTQGQSDDLVEKMSGELYYDLEEKIPLDQLFSQSQCDDLEGTTPEDDLFSQGQCDDLEETTPEEELFSQGHYEEEFEGHSGNLVDDTIEDIFQTQSQCYDLYEGSMDLFPCSSSEHDLFSDSDEESADNERDVCYNCKETLHEYFSPNLFSQFENNSRQTQPGRYKSEISKTYCAEEGIQPQTEDGSCFDHSDCATQMCRTDHISNAGQTDGQTGCDKNIATSVEKMSCSKQVEWEKSILLTKPLHFFLSYRKLLHGLQKIHNS